MFNRHLVTTRIIGGLGNQMFQYAAGRALALRTGGKLLLDLSDFERYTRHQYSLHHFDIVGEVAENRKAREYRKGRRNRRILYPWAPTLLSEPELEFEPRVLTQRPPVYLDGYWQSEDYFSDVADVIRRDFSIKTPPDVRNAELLYVMLHNPAAVAVHLRRGDYVTDSDASALHGTCSPEYYETAARRMTEAIINPTFYVFSDDPVWAKCNVLTHLDCVYLDHNGPEKNYEDLRLMTACSHFIVANSSFSWWGAWLSRNSEKIVYAPKRWFMGAKKDPEHLVPARWNRLG